MQIDDRRQSIRARQVLQAVGDQEHARLLLHIAARLERAGSPRDGRDSQQHRHGERHCEHSKRPRFGDLYCEH